MGSFFGELKRRHIYRVAAAYVVVAWVLLQLFNNLEPILKLPDWVGPLVLVLLLGGFPIAVLLAWVVEAAPSNANKKGNKPTAPATTSTRVDWIVAGALITVIALVSYQQLLPASQTRTVQASALVRSASQNEISIAVLPFANLSGDQNQEFFSDGMTDEIMTSLAKVPKLHIVGRSSAFQFKNQSRDLRAVGQALGASHVIEGSVRKSGDRIRITAELVRADTGLQVWSENYDRQLTDVFAIQEDIAQAIAGSLSVPLGLREGERLTKNRARDDATYEDYLRARSLIRARGYDRLIEAGNLLERVVARDPDFAPAWSQLALAYGYAPFYDVRYMSGDFEQWRPIVEANLAKAEAAANRAVQLDPKNPEAYLALGLVSGTKEDYVTGQEMNGRALALDPDNPDVLVISMIILADGGYIKEALGLAQRLRTLEPFVPAYNAIAAWVLAMNGQTDVAISILKPLATSGSGLGNPTANLARIYAAQGRYHEASEALGLIPDGIYRAEISDLAARLIREAPSSVLPNPVPRLGMLGFVYEFVGASDHVLDYREGSHKVGKWSAVYYYWTAPYANVRKTERWKRLMREAGYLDYWRKKGWPDLCQPTTGDDFECN
ncbi:MAG TPA: hypothetical protein VEU06_07775 [Micropepsaceae bacterium]|nr:hypothetical protein [Micropepsaceae bacterium]